jgi:MFS family permease
MLPLSLAIAVFAGRAGRLADRVGPRLPLTAGAALMALSYAGLALTMPLMLLWQVTLPVLLLSAAGMAMLVSPLSAAVMLAAPDRHTGLASGVNNAVARAAGLMAVASLGAVASMAFASVAGANLPGIEFGTRITAALDRQSEALHIAASNHAFQVIAAIAAAMCLLAALIAWFTQPSWEHARGAAVAAAAGEA